MLYFKLRVVVRVSAARTRCVLAMEFAFAKTDFLATKMATVRVSPLARTCFIALLQSRCVFRRHQRMCIVTVSHQRKLHRARASLLLRL